MNPVLDILAENISFEFQKIAEKSEWSLRDIIHVITKSQLLFEATLIAICRHEASNGSMKDYMTAIRPEAYWEYISPVFIDRPIGDVKILGLPTNVYRAQFALFKRDNLDISRDSKGQQLFEIRTALRLRSQLYQFFALYADVVKSEALRNSLLAVSDILPPKCRSNSM